MMTKACDAIAMWCHIWQVLSWDARVFWAEDVENTTLCAVHAVIAGVIVRSEGGRAAGTRYASGLDGVNEWELSDIVNV